MTPVHVDELRYLSLAMAYKGRGGTNSCVQRSAALALDVRRGVVTFGTFRAASDEEAAQIGPRASRVPFIHCWVEVDDFALAPTTVERMGGLVVPMSRFVYYEVNEAKDIRRVPRPAFDAIARRHALAASLRHYSPRFGRGKVTDELLAAAGVRYRVVGETRSLLPEAA